MCLLQGVCGRQFWVSVLDFHFVWDRVSQLFNTFFLMLGYKAQEPQGMNLTLPYILLQEHQDYRTFQFFPAFYDLNMVPMLKQQVLYPLSNLEPTLGFKNGYWIIVCKLVLYQGRIFFQKITLRCDQLVTSICLVQANWIDFSQVDKTVQ